VPAGVTVSDLSDALATLNEEFVDCDTVEGCLDYPPVEPPQEVCADFSSLGAGASVEGLGTVLPGLNITTPTGGAVVLLAGGSSPDVTYGAPNSACGKTPILNGCMDEDASDGAAGGFGDVAAKDFVQAHRYTFGFTDAVDEFSLRMLDYSDYNPPKGDQFSAVITAYDGSNTQVAQQVLKFGTAAQTNPRTSDFGDLLCGAGDACDASPGVEPGNYTWRVVGDGIKRVELTFDGPVDSGKKLAFDPNVGFDNLCFVPGQ
jgi:hypothetical protein